MIMGVTGCGKSTLGARLAGHLSCPFVEGDTLHPGENIEKMRHGTPLRDADRWPWLEERIRRRPSIGLAILVAMLAVCVWILVTAPGDDGPRSGLPMWLIALAGVAIFLFVGAKYVRVIVHRHRQK